MLISFSGLVGALKKMPPPVQHQTPSSVLPEKGASSNTLTATLQLPPNSAEDATISSALKLTDELDGGSGTQPDSTPSIVPSSQAFPSIDDGFGLQPTFDERFRNSSGSINNIVSGFGHDDSELLLDEADGFGELPLAQSTGRVQTSRESQDSLFDGKYPLYIPTL
jgi:hypothetical protein